MKGLYYIDLVLIGISLAMDAFAICLCQGLTVKKEKLKLALKLALTFGIFQAFMPWLGYHIGNIFNDKISTYGSIIAFIILVLIGLNMIREAGEDESCEVLIGLKALFSLGVATSIDALAVGLSFSMEGRSDILIPAVIIGATTFIISFIGTNLGNKVGNVLGGKAHYLGGGILILLGIKTLISNFL